MSNKMLLIYKILLLLCWVQVHLSTEAGTGAASVTSTAMPVYTVHEGGILDEDYIRYERTKNKWVPFIYFFGHGWHSTNLLDSYATWVVRVKVWTFLGQRKNWKFKLQMKGSSFNECASLCWTKPSMFVLLGLNGRLCPVARWAVLSSSRRTASEQLREAHPIQLPNMRLLDRMLPFVEETSRDGNISPPDFSWAQEKKCFISLELWYLFVPYILWPNNIVLLRTDG
jgi:hypothetical protein